MKKTKSIFAIILGTMLTGFAISVFLTPNKIVGGGVSGIATILFHTLHIPTGLSNIILNLLLLILGLGLLGKKFILKTLAGAGLISLFIQLFSYIPFETENTMLATLIGGALYGLGIGIAFAAQAYTGGTDILGRMIQKTLPTLPIGKVLLVVDGIIIFVSFIVFRQMSRKYQSVLMLPGVQMIQMNCFAF